MLAYLYVKYFIYKFVFVFVCLDIKLKSFVIV